MPNITLGPVVMKAIRTVTDKPFDVHLMIVEPERYLDASADAGADHLLIRAEQASTNHLYRTLEYVCLLGRKTGVALDLATPVAMIEHVLHLVDIGKRQLSGADFSVGGDWRCR